MNINNIKSNLIFEIEKLIEIIKNEYPTLVDIPIDYDLKELVHIKDTGTISLMVTAKNFYFPLDAFKVLETLKKIPGFGIIKNHKTCNKDNIIINNNTYITYIKHVFLKGLTPEQYFKEILLHETLHFCGSGGATAIREGINELKTRQLAKKYGLLTSACGYPKETKIAYELEKIFGERTINKISFAKNHREIKEILDQISPEATSFFFTLEETMEKEFYSKYMKYKFPGITGPLKKTQKYNSINYTEAYALINEYKRKQQKQDQKINNKISRSSVNPHINTQTTNLQSNRVPSHLENSFDERNKTEICIEKQPPKPKTLVRRNSSFFKSKKGYVNFTILIIIISFVITLIIMYLISAKKLN